jgi:hypothetical protein
MVSKRSCATHDTQAQGLVHCPARVGPINKLVVFRLRSQ